LGKIYQKEIIRLNQEKTSQSINKTFAKIKTMHNNYGEKTFTTIIIPFVSFLVMENDILNA